ncbi:GIY-YIG nuclease family protein [Polaromonas sp.]|uniref:GIY-YIG nuclease family protein n=1 Tax=Polaromonas sp. TaxID=1869339 RepID=UPI00248A16AE|nr:GIY-YIG nuclease family protein [Polaromonas sp.]MDI1272473.1 GIY-YIG nuclease family protein [Polaromonas sp.]
MKSLPLEFEPNASFCYRFARYHLLPELAQEPEALSREPFKLNLVINRVLNRYLTDEQMGLTYPARDTEGKMHQVGAAIRFFVSLRAKRGSESPFVWMGQSGMYRLKSDSELTQEAAEDVDNAVEEQVDVEFNGWIYAFTFPAIKKSKEPFPIKVGLTTAADVETRVFGQCRGAGYFEKPEILGRWPVKRVAQVEDAIHAVLKARGRWKEDAPGDEWFITTIDEVQSIVGFINP